MNKKANLNRNHNYGRKVQTSPICLVNNLNRPLAIYQQHRYEREQPSFNQPLHPNSFGLKTNRAYWQVHRPPILRTPYTGDYFLNRSDFS